MRPSRRWVHAAVVVGALLLVLPLVLLLWRDAPQTAFSGGTVSTVSHPIPVSTTISTAAPVAPSSSVPTEPPRPPDSTVPTPTVRHEYADVLVYGTTTAGAGAVRALERVTETGAEPLSVAVVSAVRHIESPLAQGLGVEDAYAGDAYLSGFYAELRRRIIAWYEANGHRAHLPGGRLVYEPEAAREVIETFFRRPGVQWHAGYPVEADAGDGSGDRFVVLREGDGTLTKVHARYFIDASPEGDLGRLLGADYMIGRGDDLYNDREDRPPPAPGRENAWKTAPQAMSMLLTLEVSDGSAPPVAALEHSWYDPEAYGEEHEVSDGAVERFAGSWSVRHMLPNGRLELNEAWSDYTNPEASFAWVLDPPERSRIRREMAAWTINRVRFLQENGHGNISVSRVPLRPYVREGVRFYGERVYRGTDIDRRECREPVAMGTYARYDRHDALDGATQDSRPATVHVPMGALMPKGHPYLLAPTAISSDESAYCSAVRMESVRGNMGAAAGIMVAVADRLGLDPHAVPYEEVRRELERQGHVLD